MQREGGERATYNHVDLYCGRWTQSACWRWQSLGVVDSVRRIVKFPISVLTPVPNHCRTQHRTDRRSRPHHLVPTRNGCASTVPSRLDRSNCPIAFNNFCCFCILNKFNHLSPTTATTIKTFVVDTLLVVYLFIYKLMLSWQRMLLPAPRRMLNVQQQLSAPVCLCTCCIEWAGDMLIKPSESSIVSVIATLIKDSLDVVVQYEYQPMNECPRDYK